MTITLSTAEIAAVSPKPFSELSLLDKRWTASKILRHRPGNWDREIFALESGNAGANNFNVVTSVR